jgi:hypothetical protein
VRQLWRSTECERKGLDAWIEDLYLLEKASAMKRKSKLKITIAMVVLAVLGAVAVCAQDKYSLKSPSGIAFSDFRGYEDWAVVSSARTDGVLKVIVANPTMIKAYKERPAFLGWLQDREAPAEAEEEHGCPLRRGCARRF